VIESYALIGGVVFTLVSGDGYVHIGGDGYALVGESTHKGNKSNNLLLKCINFRS